MRRLLRHSKKRSSKPDEEDVEALHGQRAVEPDEEVNASAHGNRMLIEDGHSAIRDPESWAKQKRKSQTRGRPHSNTSSKVGSSFTSVSGSHRSAGAASAASRITVDDLYSDDIAVESVLNPDVEHQIDADSDEFDELDLPRPGTFEKAPRASPRNRDNARSPPPRGTSKRLSSRLGKMLGMGKAAGGAAVGLASAAGRPKSPLKSRASSTSRPKSLIKETSKRLSFRKPGSAEKRSLEKSAKLRAKQEKKEEERRQREIRSNPWYPAGVDFKYLSPKATWVPFLGRKASTSELDFGNEARLVGAVA
mmetsp:Transcript_12004/g.22227  ORF Transcript_12004/g.22227 Transcript_12004/m.22227 type:complete len:307 (+) Transcript_12004:644-1564(+)